MQPTGRARVSYHVELEKADALARSQPLTLLLNGLMLGSVFAILQLNHPDPHLVLWIGCVVLANFVRWVMLCFQPAHSSFLRSPRMRLRISVAFSLVIGLLWGWLPLVLVNFHRPEAFFIAMILGGLTSGAALQGGGYKWPVIALAAPTLLPLITRLAMLGTASGDVLAFDVLLYLGVIVRSSATADSAFTKLADLRWKADALADDLKRQHEVTQATADRLFQLANCDPLTGAANRAAFTQQLEAWLERAREQRSAVSLLLIDLDHFKAVNDTLGHGAGDEVLRVVAARLSAVEGAERFVARLGGDEFAVLLRATAATADARLAADLIEHVSAPLTVRGHPVNVGASIGLARHPDDAATGEELLARADLALYAAKASGRQAWRRFEPALLSQAELAREIERELPAALLKSELEVWFQPQVEIFGGRPIGVECLLRWRHPRLGWLPPAEIVAAALRLRLSRALSRYVLERACKVTPILDAAGFNRASVAVNICPREMSLYDLEPLVIETCNGNKVEPLRLEIEITEEAVLDKTDAIETLAALRGRGVRLALDDFGTGNSSIAYLRHLTMDRIKIDRTFVSDIAVNGGDRALVQAIVSMGRSLGVEVIAEGVETSEQALVLSSVGCQFAQGYLYGKAMPEAELAAYLDGARRAGRDKEARRPVVTRLNATRKRGR